MLPIRTAVGSFSFYDSSFPTFWTRLADDFVGGLQRHLLGCGSLGFLSLDVLVGGNGNRMRIVFSQYIVDDGGDLLFQFVDELSCIILAMLDVTKFLFPDTR